jgi:hypothetical protein
MSGIRIGGVLRDYHEAAGIELILADDDRLDLVRDGKIWASFNDRAVDLDTIIAEADDLAERLGAKPGYVTG